MWVLERKTGRTRLLPIYDLVYTPGKPAPVYDGSSIRKMSVIQMCFSHDGEALFMRGGLNYVQKMSMSSGKIVETFDYQNKLEAQSLSAMALSPGDRTLLMGGRDGQVKLFNFAASRLVRVLKTQRPFVASVAFSGDGSRIITVSLTPAPSKPTPVSTMRENATGSVEVWETSSGKLLRSTSLSNLDIYVTRLSRGGAYLIGSYVNESDFVDSAQIWDVRRQSLTNRFSTGYPTEIKGYVTDVALSPDNSVLVVLSDAKKYHASTASYVFPFLTLYKGRLQLWPRVPSTGDTVLVSPSAPIVSIDIPARPSSVAWAPDARSLIVVGDDGMLTGPTIQIYSVD
jgi:WD40 repeat protein